MCPEKTLDSAWMLLSMTAWVSVLSVGDSRHEVRRHRIHGHQFAARFLVGSGQSSSSNINSLLIYCWKPVNWISIFPINGEGRPKGCKAPSSKAVICRNSWITDVFPLNAGQQVSKRLKVRVTMCRSPVLDKQKCFQLSSELAETVRWPQWSRQLVPKPRSGDIKQPVAQRSSGPWYDACDGARRAETATGLRRWLARVWEIRRCTAV